MDFQVPESRRNNAGSVRQNSERLSGRDIAWEWDKLQSDWVPGWRPKYTDEGEKRRELCRLDLERFLFEYAKPSFFLEFSDDLRSFISLVQSTIVDGHKSTFALPRGSGKTTILRLAILWAAIYGYHNFSMLAAADDPKARRMLRVIKSQLERNPILNEDFPEVCGPIRKLNGSPTRAVYQLYNGVSTDLVFQSDLLILPTIPDSVERGNAGCAIGVGGIESAIRGANVTRPSTNESMRPTLILVDDPQTRKTAKSDEMTNDRLQIITGDMLGLAPPDKELSALVAGTVIRTGDLMEKLLNPKICPGWKSFRVSMLKVFPSNTELWNEYKKLRLAAHTEQRDPDDANAFYVENREAMDLGAEVYWPARFSGGAISAVQDAMNRFIDDPESFASEYQNSPLDSAASDSSDGIGLHDKLMFSCISEVPAGKVPIDANRLVSFIDVSQKVLWWSIYSVTDAYKMHCVKYSCWPEQHGFVTKDNVDISLQQHYGLSLRESIATGLSELIEHIMGNTWETEHGESVSISRGAVDAHWGEMTGLVRDTVWKSPYSSLWLPSDGMGIGASSKQLNDIKASPKRREERGANWRIEPEYSGLRLLYDTNFWKSFGANLVHGKSFSMHAGSIRSHQMLIDHFTAEYPTEVTSKYRKVNEWKLRPRQSNEHQWDCFVACCVLANIIGIDIPGDTSEVVRRKPRRVWGAR